MDWDRIEDLISQHNDLILLDNLSFIIAFLETLLKALKGCMSVQQCSTLYPRAGPILTKAATHPYVGCQVKLTKLVAHCLVEYTKYDLGTDNTTPLPRSSLWCLQRLRRLNHCALATVTVLTKSNLNERYNKVTELLQQGLKCGTLTMKNVKLISEKMAVLLIESGGVAKNDDDDDDMKGVTRMVAAWTDAALQLLQRQQEVMVKVHHGMAQCTINSNNCVSDRFVHYLLAHKEERIYLQCPIDLKTKLWRLIPDLFEYEWMQWIERQLDKQHLFLELDNTLLLQGLRHCPDLMQRSLAMMAHWLCETGLADWQLIQLWIKVAEWMMMTQNLEVAFSPETLDLHSMMVFYEQVDQVYARTMSFIYEGSPLELEARRNQAWLISMMNPRYVSYCINSWIQECCKEKTGWSEKMDDIASFLAWLICPSLDDRMTCAEKTLKDWIVTLRGYHHHYQDPSTCASVLRFIDHWYVLFAGHLHVSMSVLVAMIHRSEWSTQQAIQMINRFLDGLPFDKASIYIPLLDRLGWIEDDHRMVLLISHVNRIIRE